MEDILGMYKCWICQKDFFTFTQLVNHVRTCPYTDHNILIEHFKENYCPKGFDLIERGTPSHSNIFEIIKNE